MEAWIGIVITIVGMAASVAYIVAKVETQGQSVRELLELKITHLEKDLSGKVEALSERVEKIDEKHEKLAHEFHDCQLNSSFRVEHSGGV
jgi:hypothetical protein